MTTFEWPEPIPGWDMLKWKDETQAEILRETAGMTDDEVLDYFRRGAERFEKKMELRRAELLKKETA